MSSQPLTFSENHYHHTIYMPGSLPTTQFITHEAPAPQPAFMGEAWTRNLEEQMRHMFAEQSNLISNKFDQLRVEVSALSVPYNANLDPYTTYQQYEPATFINNQYAHNSPQYEQATHMPMPMPMPMQPVTPQPVEPTEANSYDINTNHGTHVYDGSFYTNGTQVNDGTENPTYGGLSQHSPYSFNDESGYVFSPAASAVSEAGYQDDDNSSDFSDESGYVTESDCFSPAIRASKARYQDDDDDSGSETTTAPGSPSDTLDEGKTPIGYELYVSELSFALTPLP